MSTQQDVAGVTCGKCGEETFQVFHREVTHEVGVCKHCAAVVDLGNEEQMVQEAAASIDKAERKQYLKEKSFEWASGLHGKKVTVFWDCDAAQIFASCQSQCSARGTAYMTRNTSGGWGQVRVILDKDEHSRISVGCLYTGYCRIVEKDMYFASNPLPCNKEECEHQRFIMDRHRWGLFVGKDSEEFFTLISWGCRKSLVADPSSEYF